MKIKVICNSCNKVQVIEKHGAKCECGGTSFTFVDFDEAIERQVTSGLCTVNGEEAMRCFDPNEY